MFSLLNHSRRRTAPLALMLTAALLTGCGPEEPAEPTIPVTPAVTLEADILVPPEVSHQALQYVTDRAARFNEQWLQSAPGCSVSQARITAITQIPTGTVGLESSQDLYRLEFRLKVEGPIESVLTDGATQEDGWLTEYTAEGQPYLLFRSAPGKRFLIAETTEAEMARKFSTPEYLEQYADIYQAAAVELWAQWQLDYLEQHGKEIVCRNGIRAMVPAYALDCLQLHTDGSSLLSLWDKAAVNQARADGQDADSGLGWLFDIAEYDRAQFEQLLVSDAPGLSWLGTCDDRYFALLTPTDQRYYRSPDEDNSKSRTLWSQLNAMSWAVSRDFITRNGLTPFTRDELCDGYTWDSRHLYYNTPDGETLVLSQPATNSEDGIWCVERILGNGIRFWFPNTGMPAQEYYDLQQEMASRGIDTQLSTPAGAIQTYYAQSGREPYPFEDLIPVQLLPDPAEFLAHIRPEHVDRLLYSENVKLDQLISSMVRAAGSPMEQEFNDGFMDTGAPYWSVALAMKQPAGVTCELNVGLTEDMVQVCLLNDTLTASAWFRDAWLYRLIRHSSDQPELIDREALEQFEPLLTKTMEDTLSRLADSPAVYYAYELDAFTPILSYTEDDGAQVVVYDFQYALLARHPERIRWVGGMSMDGDLKVRHVSPTGPLAVRWRDGAVVAHDFLGFDFQWGPSVTPDLEWVDWALDRAEERAALPVRADYHVEVSLPEEHSFFQDGYTEYHETVVFQAQVPVTGLRFFAVDWGGEGENWGPLEGRTLYSQDRLDPGTPLVVSTSFPGDMPNRGISFELEGRRLAYTLSTSGRDGSLVLALIP